MKKKVVLQMGKGLVLAYIISAVVLVLLAFLMFQMELSEGVVRGVIIFAYVLSCFISGMIVSSNREGRHYLWGLLQGVLYYVVLLTVSMICNRAVFTQISGVIPAFFLCSFGGMLGGMLHLGKK